MNTASVKGIIDFNALYSELTAALGAAGTAPAWRWTLYVAAGDGVASVTFDQSCDQSVVQATLDAHVSAAAVAARAAAITAELSRDQQDAAEQAALEADTAMMAFINMTPAQIDNYVQANVTDLASAKVALARLAKIVNVAIRKQIR